MSDEASPSREMVERERDKYIGRRNFLKQGLKVGVLLAPAVIAYSGHRRQRSGRQELERVTESRAYQTQYKEKLEDPQRKIAQGRLLRNGGLLTIAGAGIYHIGKFRERSGMRAQVSEAIDHMDDATGGQGVGKLIRAYFEEVGVLKRKPKLNRRERLATNYLISKGKYPKPKLGIAKEEEEHPKPKLGIAKEEEEHPKPGPETPHSE